MEEDQKCIMEIAWRDFIHWAMGNSEMRKAFEAETKIPPLGRSPIEIMVDKGSGFETDYLTKFMFWATAFHWGMDCAPELVREEWEKYETKEMIGRK